MPVQPKANLRPVSFLDGVRIEWEQNEAIVAFAVYKARSGDIAALLACCLSFFANWPLGVLANNVVARVAAVAITSEKASVRLLFTDLLLQRSMDCITQGFEGVAAAVFKLRQVVVYSAMGPGTRRNIVSFSASSLLMSKSFVRGRPTGLVCLISAVFEEAVETARLRATFVEREPASGTPATSTLLDGLLSLRLANGFERSGLVVSVLEAAIV
ncbi:hypothetical protein EJ08DRAFT_245946 [Tothia fuscella]|uniref:Uncharacterized protein n=1 Tax=Tothia fuscella TaxID=1048955 RepID=A0A9P4TYU4_9PEZI|nr:hypothetical protein EJ08DRAFT_245946 [Tothia fuscella]